MNRRDFLKKCTVGAGVAVVAPMSLVENEVWWTYPLPIQWMTIEEIRKEFKEFKEGRKLNKIIALKDGDKFPLWNGNIMATVDTSTHLSEP